MLFITTLFFDPQPLRRALDGAIGGLAVAGAYCFWCWGWRSCWAVRPWAAATLSFCS
ncbi:MAG: hypothetical protein ACLR5H_12735 [Oscillospiraceae bacterium]